jgi:hypothetical protein
MTIPDGSGSLCLPQSHYLPFPTVAREKAWSASLKANDFSQFDGAVEHACHAPIADEPEITHMDNIPSDGDCGLTLKGKVTNRRLHHDNTIQYTNILIYDFSHARGSKKQRYQRQRSSQQHNHHLSHRWGRYGRNKRGPPLICDIIKAIKPGASIAASEFKRRNVREGPLDVIGSASTTGKDEEGRPRKGRGQIKANHRDKVRTAIALTSRRVHIDVGLSVHCGVSFGDRRAMFSGKPIMRVGLTMS